jgi:hypothetical protein
MGTTMDAVTGTISKPMELCMYNMTTGWNPLKADYCCGRGNGKPKNGYHHSKKYYPSIAASSVRP